MYRLALPKVFFSDFRLRISNRIVHWAFLLLTWRILQVHKHRHQRTVLSWSIMHSPKVGLCCIWLSSFSMNRKWSLSYSKTAVIPQWSKYICCYMGWFCFGSMLFLISTYWLFYKRRDGWSGFDLVVDSRLTPPFPPNLVRKIKSIKHESLFINQNKGAYIGLPWSPLTDQFFCWSISLTFSCGVFAQIIDATASWVDLWPE